MVALAGAAAALHLILAVTSADPGMHSGGDNAAYLSLANALAQGDGYVESWQPGSPPHTKYPPLYPGVLAILIMAGVQSWAAFKLLSAALTALAVAFCFLWARQRVGAAGAAAVALLFAISPALLDSSQWVLSEALFTACIFGCLWLLATGHRSPIPLLCGLALAIAAWYTRSAGLPLVAAAALWLALARRWRSLATLSLLFIPVALLWQLRAGGDYVSEFRLVNPYAPDFGLAGPADFAARIGVNLTGYALQHIPAAIAGLRGSPAAIAGALLTLAALLGWVRAVRSGGSGDHPKRYAPGPDPAELFLPLYAGLILIWPQVWSGERFALPLLPLLFLYAGDTLARVGSALARTGRIPPRRAAWISVALAALPIALPALHRWQQRAEWASECRPLVLARGPLGCNAPRVVEMQAIALSARTLLPEGSAVFSRKPRIFHLFSGLPSVTYPFTEDPDRLLAAADSLGIGHLVLGNLDATGQRYLRPAISAHPERFCVLSGLQLGEGPPVLLLEIRPPASDDSPQGLYPAPAEEGTLARCSESAPAPLSPGALASPRIPLFARPDSP